MRLAVVHPFSWPEVRRGAERYVDDLAWAMDRRGHDVDIITTSADADRPSPGVGVLKVRRVAPSRLQRRGVTSMETFGLSVLPVLTRRRYDVVHAMVPAAALAARMARQRVVFSVIGHPGPGSASVRRRLQRRLLGGAVRRSNAAATLSEASARAVASTFGRTPSVLAPGVRLDRFVPDLEPRTGAPRVLFSAFAGDRRKRLDVLLRAFLAVLDRHPDARLVISGGGDPGWALQALGAERERVSAGLDLLGTGGLADVPRHYREACVTVLPAENEAFGLAVVESLASGTPVVCSDSGGMPEIVDCAEVGRVAPAGEPAAFAAAILDCIELASRPETPGRCAEHAARWSWTGRTADEHEAIYRDVACRGRPPRPGK